MGGAVVAALVLIVLLPDGERIGPPWLLPLLAGLLLVALIAGDPGKIDRRSNVLRVVSIALVFVLVANSLWATAQLIDALINGGKETNSASALLAAGTTVWVSNCLAFALLYWELDSGGAAARAHRVPDHPDFAFPQQLNPDVAPVGWRPPLRRLPLPGFHKRDSVQPDRRDAARTLGQARDDRAVADLARDPRPRDRPGGERFHVSTRDRILNLVAAIAFTIGGACSRWARPSRESGSADPTAPPASTSPAACSSIRADTRPCCRPSTRPAPIAGAGGVGDRPCRVGERGPAVRGHDRVRGEPGGLVHPGANRQAGEPPDLGAGHDRLRPVHRLGAPRARRRSAAGASAGSRACSIGGSQC